RLLVAVRDRLVEQQAKRTLQLEGASEASEPQEAGGRRGGGGVECHVGGGASARSLQQLDFDALAAVGGGARQGAHGVDQPPAPADDAADVVGCARHLDLQVAVVARGGYLEAVGF